MVVSQKQLKANRRLRISNVPDVASLDPEEVFEVRYTTALKEGTGYDRLALSLIPKTIIKSAALALDPFARFAAGKEIITPVNRLRTRSESFPANRKLRTVHDNRTKNRTYNGAGVPTNEDIPFYTNTTASRSTQPVLQSTTRDTTTRTRPANSKFGEFEHFSWNLSIPEFTMTVNDDIDTYADSLVPGNDYLNFTKSRKRTQWNSEGGYCFLPAASLISIKNGAFSDISANMQKTALSLLPKTVPEARRYSLFRNIVELKDIPLGIRTLYNTLSDLVAVARSLGPERSRLVFNLTANIQNIPKEYVSYNFGWKQLYNDIVGLLALPEKLTKEVNFLIGRDGIPTTFRSKKKLLLPSVSLQPFSYDMSLNEIGPVTNGTHFKELEYRLVVNAIFDFPKALIPKLREELISRKIGLNPTPTDVYNLIPWSWLVDWFTGLGNYIECIDAVNTDRSTFNYGFITGVLTGRVESLRSAKYKSSYSVQYVPNAPQIQESFSTSSVQSVVSYRATVRKSLGSLSGVKLTSDVSTLSTYQSSILGSILLSRIKKTR